MEKEKKSEAEILNFKTHAGHHLPYGLDKKGKEAWEKLSHLQHKAANDVCALNRSYHKRVCEHLNNPKFKLDVIDKGGCLKGLTAEGKQAWHLIPHDLQLEVFLCSIDGTAENVAKFLNKAWFQYKEGTLEEGTFLHAVQTLAAEVEEKRMVQ